MVQSTSRVTESDSKGCVHRMHHIADIAASIAVGASDASNDGLPTSGDREKKCTLIAFSSVSYSVPLRAWKPRPGCRRFPVSPATAGCGSSIGNRSALSTAGLVVDSTQLVVRQIEAVGTETLVGLVPARVKEGSKTPLNPQGWCMEEAEKRDASSSRCLHAGALGQSKELTTSTGSSGQPAHVAHF